MDFGCKVKSLQFTQRSVDDSLSLFYKRHIFWLLWFMPEWRRILIAMRPQRKIEKVPTLIVRIVAELDVIWRNTVISLFSYCLHWIAVLCDKYRGVVMFAPCTVQPQFNWSGLPSTLKEYNFRTLVWQCCNVFI